MYDHLLRACSPACPLARTALLYHRLNLGDVLSCIHATKHVLGVSWLWNQTFRFLFKPGWYLFRAGNRWISTSGIFGFGVSRFTFFRKHDLFDFVDSAENLLVNWIVGVVIFHLFWIVSRRLNKFVDFAHIVFMGTIKGLLEDISLFLLQNGVFWLLKKRRRKMGLFM